MSLLEKIKINIDYLRGKADPSLYAPDYRGQNINLEEWQKRWEVFSDDNCGYVWYGVDSEGYLAEFACERTYIPEVFFQDGSINQRIHNFFRKLPEITTTKLPDNLRPVLKRHAEKLLGVNPKDYWSTGANRGLFIFEETDDNNFYGLVKKPYELILIPDNSLKLDQLPEEIQNLLEPYRFENLRFADCRFLDVSQYFYCEK